MQNSLSARPAKGHPIRRQFGSAPARSADRSAPVARAAANKGDEDLKLFALSFTAFFICIYTLIF